MTVITKFFEFSKHFERQCYVFVMNDKIEHLWHKPDGLLVVFVPVL